jgi:cytochrome c biogenesis factor
MQDIQYIGENLLPGSLGHFLIILAFSAALLSSYSFFQANSRSGDESTSWKKIGRISFLVHGFSIFTVIGLIFYLMLNERYEYQYVWAHVNSELPKRYIFSAFWEGQEGSFLLWMFWHVILGFVIIYKNNSWEKPVIGILSLVQVFIVTMIMGVYFNIGTHGLKFGSNPFMLLRETMDAPIFSNPDYLKLIKGKGLNPLLQNYWMTIHPSYPFSWIRIYGDSFLLCSCSFDQQTIYSMAKASFTLGAVFSSNFGIGYFNGSSLGIRGPKLRRILGMGSCRKHVTCTLVDNGCCYSQQCC